VVADGVRVGVNDDLQSAGLHPLERDEGGAFRWMGAGEASFLTRKPAAGAATLVIEGFTPPVGPDDLPLLTCRLEGQERTWRAEAPGRFRCELELEGEPGVREVRLRATGTWSPARAGAGTDARELGYALTSVGWKAG
jgi:hypothetical protein